MKCLTGKGPDAGKDRGQEEKRAKEDEMVGWHHQLKECEFEQTLGDSKGQGSLACCTGSTGSQRVGCQILLHRPKAYCCRQNNLKNKLTYRIAQGTLLSALW